jgi:quercetin dioxygenase-like cupin family protein
MQKGIKITKAEMEENVVRFPDDYTKENAVPLMFIDSLLPGHHRLNYAVIGDTASENTDYRPLLDKPHNFQIGMFKAMPGNGPAWHSHDYIEAFFPLEGTWRFYFSEDPDNAREEYVELEKWDLISLPAGMWRRFENVGDEPAWCLAVLEPHEAYTGKDPYWAASVIEKAREHGFEATEQGEMVKPENFDELDTRLREEMYNA